MSSKKPQNPTLTMLKWTLIKLLVIYSLNNLVIPPLNNGICFGSIVDPGTIGIESNGIGIPSISARDGTSPPAPRTLQLNDQQLTSLGSSGDGVDSGGRSITHSSDALGFSDGGSRTGDPSDNDDDFRVYILAQTIPKVYYLFCKSPPRKKADIGSVVHGLWLQKEEAKETITREEVKQRLNREFRERLHKIWRCLKKNNSKKDSIGFWLSEYKKHAGKHPTFLDYALAIERLELDYRASNLLRVVVAKMPKLDVITLMHRHNQYSGITLGSLQKLLVEQLTVSPIIVTDRDAGIDFVEEIHIVFAKDLKRKLNHSAATMDWVKGSRDTFDENVFVYF